MVGSSSYGALSVFKGSKTRNGKGKGKQGKGGKGYGYRGKSKGYKGRYYNSYKSLGKGVGKGLNSMDWHNAWGSEEQYDYYGDDWYGYDSEQHLGYRGSLTMLLERGESEDKKERETDKIGDKDKTMRVKGEHDPLRNTARNNPLALHTG